MHFPRLLGYGVALPVLSYTLVLESPFFSFSSFLIAVYIRTALHTCGFYTFFVFVYIVNVCTASGSRATSLHCRYALML